MFGAELDVALVWAGLIALAVLAYVILDGFDLGVGLLFPLFPDGAERDLMINTIAPVWDGNETWLVLGGGGLFAVFPLAYATLMPALYAPLIAMLLGLIFRGVAFEFRWRTRRGKAFWDWAFVGGSVVAALGQGIALGAIIQGIRVVDRQYAGGWWDWLTPFSLLTGVSLAVGYALLGATWLNMKTGGDLQIRARRCAWVSGALLLALIGVVSVWTPFLNPVFLSRWFAWPAIAYSAVVPVLLAGCALLLFRSLAARHDHAPFLAALGIFILCYIGILISFYPYMVPPSLTLWQVAAPVNSQQFLLVGTVVLLPLIVCYTAYAYWVFRGKVDPEEGFH